jgi:hypothetical protein
MATGPVAPRHGIWCCRRGTGDLACVERRRMGCCPDMGASLASAAWPNAASRRRRIRCIRCREWPWAGAANERAASAIPMFRPPISWRKDSCCVVRSVQASDGRFMVVVVMCRDSIYHMKRPSMLGLTLVDARHHIYAESLGIVYRVATMCAGGVTLLCPSG